MATPLRPRAVPQCTACLRNHAFSNFNEAATTAAASGTGARRAFTSSSSLQKKKMPNNSATVTVRLLKPMQTFGRKGAIVPVQRGQMRNNWFPRRIAEYVTVPELKTLKLNKVSMERDYAFGQRSIDVPDAKATYETSGDPFGMSAGEIKSASAFQRVEVEKLSPERSKELVEIFVGPRLEFYRQPIMEEKAEGEEAKAEEKKDAFTLGSGAAAELLAARTPVAKKQEVKDGSAIYGSVSAKDVLQAVRATMGRNDEAARVVLQEEDIHFVDLPETEHSEAGKIKHIGDFSVEIKVRGSEAVVKRVVRIIPQEA